MLAVDVLQPAVQGLLHKALPPQRFTQQKSHGLASLAQYMGIKPQPQRHAYFLCLPVLPLPRLHRQITRGWCQCWLRPALLQMMATGKVQAWSCCLPSGRLTQWH